MYTSYNLIQTMWIIVMYSCQYLICLLHCRIVLKLYPLDLGTSLVVYIQMLQTASRQYPKSSTAKILKLMWLNADAMYAPNIMQISHFIICKFIEMFSVNACLWLGWLLKSNCTTVQLTIIACIYTLHVHMLKFCPQLNWVQNWYACLQLGQRLLIKMLLLVNN